MQGPLARRRGGFSLIEMVVVIVLMGIVSASFAVFIVPAVNAYNASVQRATLVDAAESALRRMARDIRIAVPNSVRVTNSATGFTLEMVPSVDGGRFCATGLADCGAIAGSGLTAAQQVLEIGSADSEFDILGFFQDATFTGAPGAYRLAIGNTGAEIYVDSGSPQVITPSATTLSLSTDVDRHHVTLSAAHAFPTVSPRQRVFVIRKSEAPVAYICDKTAGTLTRYWNYAFTAAPATGTSALVANAVSDCAVATATSDVQNTGMVVLGLTLSNSVAGDVTLMHQAQLDNSP